MTVQFPKLFFADHQKAMLVTETEGIKKAFTAPLEISETKEVYPKNLRSLFARKGMRELLGKPIF